MAENKNARQIKEITDRLEEGIKELFESERFREYLTTMSKFYNYSFNNTLLIAMQKPEATLVAGYTSWKRNFQRHVMKGEKGIKIIAPSPYKEQTEKERLDPVTKKPVLDSEGKPIMDTVEVVRPGYKVVSVYDVSQTDGKELPDIAVDELKGSVENYTAFFDALKEISPVPISLENVPGAAKGFFSNKENRIAIQEGMSEVQTVKTAIHEIAHAKLHAVSPNEKAAPEDMKNRRTKEVKAESVAYTVCQRYGIETSDYSFGYIAGWSSDMETKELKGSLETIRKTAGEMIESIDAKLRELTAEKEQGKGIAADNAGLTEKSEALKTDDFKPKLTQDEKLIKIAVLDVLKGQISRSNDGELSTYRVSEQSHKIMYEHGVRISGDTVIRQGEPLFAVHRRYSAKKTQGCYRELTPNLEYIAKEKAQEKPSIREQLKKAKEQTENKEKTQERKLKSKEMEM